MKSEIKQYSEIINNLKKENESLKKDYDHKSEQVLNLLDRNRLLKEENYKIMSDIRYYNGYFYCLIDNLCGSIFNYCELGDFIYGSRVNDLLDKSTYL